MDLTAIDAEDARILASGLRACHVQALDALGHCAGKPHYPDFKRTEPSWAQADEIRETLDRLERLADALGRPIAVSRRADAERFFEAESEKWWREQNPHIIQAEPESAEC